MKNLRFIARTTIGLLIFVCGSASITSKDPSERLQAVKNVQDQTMLAQLAVKDTSPDVREAAFDKLTDPAGMGTNLTMVAKSVSAKAAKQLDAVLQSN